MSTREKLIKARLGMLALAEELQNISLAPGRAEGIKKQGRLTNEKESSPGVLYFCDFAFLRAGACRAGSRSNRAYSGRRPPR